MPSVRLGILELASVEARRGPETTLNAIVRLATAAEQAGFSRLWFTEHHSPFVSVATPDLLLPFVGAETETLRLGVAGVLLRLHRPFVVAERFALLSHMLPGRVDLGVARGGADAATEVAMLDGHRPEDETRFSGRVARLAAALDGRLPPPLVPPAREVEIWMLGSRTSSARVARELSLPYCHSLFLEDPPMPAPEHAAAIAVAGVCAPSTAIAGSQVTASDHSFIRPLLVGSPGECASRLRDLAEEHGVDEVLFLDLCNDADAHLESYLLLAAALNAP